MVVGVVGRVVDVEVDGWMGGFTSYPDERVDLSRGQWNRPSKQQNKGTRQAKRTEGQDQPSQTK